MSCNFRQSTAFMGVLFFLFTAPVAQAADVGSFVGRLEQALKTQEKLDLVTAHASIIAWVCVNHTGSSEGVAFDACCKDTADLIFMEKSKKNFLGIASRRHVAIEEMLENENASVEEFWSEFGVLPLHAAVCAKAMLDYHNRSGFWNSLEAGDGLQKCMPENLSPELNAELQRRWP